MEQMTTGPVTFDDVRAALGEQDPATTNAGALRKLLGRGSLSTIQKHLDSLRAQAAQPAEEVVGEVPKPPADLLQGLWAHAWAAAQAMVQTALSTAQAKAESLAVALGMAQQDAVAAQSEADQARDDLVAVVSRLEGLEGQHKAAVEQIQGAHQEQVLALRAGLAEARQEAEAAQHELAVAQARHALETATLRGELDRQISVMADLRMALQRPLPALEPVLSKEESGAS